MFKYCEWNEKPSEVVINHNNYIVSRNVKKTERDGITLYIGEVAYMNETQYAAYIGAKEIELKREQDIADETVLELIEEGSL